MTPTGVVLPDSPDSGMELHLLLSAVFSALMTSEAARTKLCLSGISQRLQGLAPGWFLWRADAPGGFALVLAGEGYRGGNPRCSFAIKYYPALESDPAFDGLSVYEQSVRLGEAFDHTGVPAFGQEATLDERAFAVGRLEMEFNKQSGLLSLACSAEERWQVRLKRGLTVEGPDGQPVTLVEAGGLDRNLPGWEYAWKVYDSLITAIGLYFARQPLGVALAELPGTLYEQGEGDLRSVSAPAQLAYKSVCFFVPGDEQNLGLAASDYDPFTLLDGWLAAEALPDEALKWLLVQPPAELLPWVNPEWWVARAEGDLSDIGLCCLLGHDTANMHK